MPLDRPPSAPDPSPRVRFDLVNVALATTVVVLVIQAFQFIGVIQSVVILFLLAIILATALEPLVLFFHRVGVRRGVSVLLIYVVVVAVLTVFTVILVNAIITQIGELLVALPRLTISLILMADSLPSGVLRDSAIALVAGLNAAKLHEEVNSLLTSNTLSGLLFATVGILRTVFALVTVLVLAYFWIAERLTIRRLILSLIGSASRDRARAVWENVELKLGQWARGQLLLMLIIGVLAGVGYSVLGLPYALLLGVWAALTEIIPLFGPYLGALPAVLVALAQSPTLALAVVGYAVVVNLIEGNYLVPRIMQQTVGLSPLTVILALLAGGDLYGVLGALLAVPVAAGIQAAIQELILTRPQAAETPPAAESPSDRVA